MRRKRFRGLGLLIAMTAAVSYAQTTVTENFETGFETSTNRIDVTTTGTAIGGASGVKLKALADSVNYNHDNDDGTTAEVSGSYVSVIDEDVLSQRYYQIKPGTANPIHANLQNLNDATYGTNVVQVNIPFAGYGTRGVDDSTIPDGLLATNSGAIIDFGENAGTTLTGFSFNYQKITSKYYSVAVFYSSNNGNNWTQLGNTAVNTDGVDHPTNNWDGREIARTFSYSGSVTDVDQLRIMFWCTEDHSVAFAVDNLSITSEAPAGTAVIASALKPNEATVKLRENERVYLTVEETGVVSTVRVEQSAVGADTWTTSTVVDIDATPIVVTGLTDDTNYDFRLIYNTDQISNVVEASTKDWASSLNSKDYPFAWVPFGQITNEVDPNFPGDIVDQTLGIFGFEDSEATTVISYDVTSDPRGSTYADHTATTATTEGALVKGSDYTVSVRNWVGSNKWFGTHAWADWNGDGDFDDVGEKLIGKAVNGVTTLTETITVPTDAVDNVLVRVRTFVGTGNLDKENDAWGSSHGKFTGVKDFKITTTTSTPAIGLEVVQTGNEVKWTVEQELDVLKYQLVDVATGDVVETIAVDGKGEYFVIVEEGVIVELIVIDKDGSEQTFIPSDGNVVTVEYKLTEGWNLIATTGNYADLSEVEMATAGTMWAWDGSKYVATDAQDAYQGIWVYAPEAKVVKATALKADSTLTLNAGWTLAGPANNVSAPEAATVFSWTTKYSEIIEKYNALVMGQGYWFFVTEETEVTVD